MTENQNKLAEKKEAVFRNDKKKRAPLVVAAAVCLAILIAGGFFYLKSDDGSANAAGNVSPQVEQIVPQITYPVGLFEGGKAQHFEYADQGVTIEYFILKSSDGVVRAAFDACDVCWKAGKGYYQDGDDMVCRNCEMRFPSVKINEVEGGCNPAPLARKISGDKVVILVDDILEGKKYFDFSKI